MENSRKKVLDIFTHSSNASCALWTGNPKPEILPILADAWGIEPTNEAVYKYLGDDCRWIPAAGEYHHPDGINAIDTSYGVERKTLSAGGFFADAEELSDLDKYPWPDVKYCDFTHIYSEIDKYPDKMVFTGLWSPFFHLVSDFLGMENYLIKLHENPILVEALTERIVDYLVGASELFFQGLGDRADVMFFGNDFGTQLDLFMSPEHFRRFVLPSFRRLVNVGKKYNKLIMLHSCGSIYRIIPDLIDCGVDIIHPIQAKAAGMSAKELAQYKNDLAFVGGIDAQDIMPFGKPEEVYDEVMRVREILGPSIVISPSHEAILQNVPPENILAMAKAAKA